MGCKYKHENNQEKINNLEKQMDKQKEELEEKNAYILQLELRLGEIEKKFKEEQIRTDKRIRDLENANKSKNNEKNEDTSFKCKDCEFDTISKRGLRVHIKKTRLSSIVSQPIKVVVDAVIHVDIVVVVVFIVVVVYVIVVVMVVVDPRNLPLKSGQNWAPNS